MTPLAIENVGLLAAAPKGIQRLRALILDLAVRGKLVSHGASEPGAASSNLQIPDGPFALPTGWRWVRLREITAKIGAGSTPLGGKKAYVAQGIKFLRSQNVWNQGLRLEDVALISEKTHQKMSGTHIAPGDLLFNITGASIGRCAIVPDDFDAGNVSQHVTIVRPSLPDVRNYLHIALTSELVQRMVMSEQVGVSREGLSIAKLSQFQIPLPPLAEQHRIVAKVDELMALCDKLEAEQQDAEAAHAQLVQALLDSLIQSADANEFHVNWQLLAEHFHTLFTTNASVDALKQAVMQLAVTGKVVPQECSEQLVEGLPAGWQRLRIEEFCNVQGGIQKTPLRQPVMQHFPYLRVANVQRGRIDVAELARYELTVDELERWRLLAGDLLIVEGNGSETEIGRCAIWHGEVPDCVYQNHLMRVRPAEAEQVRYLAMYLNSPVGMTEMRRLAITTSGLFNLSVGKIRSIPVDLPPLEEQHRIVAKVAELLALCDQLKAGIALARQQHEQLAAALVEQAVA